MQRDFKIGLAVGIAAAAIAMLWLCTRPKLSTESRILRAASAPSTAPVEILKPPEPIQTSNPVQTARFHIVQKGDTLSAISQKYYGTPRYWQKILAANDKILKDPDRLVPGTRLLIPE
ncbi:MAG: LysM peptidoglycan-binding domain-containing protein [Planctomycetota bacterium]